MTTERESLAHIAVGSGSHARAIAVRARAGAAPGIFWLGGFRSDMQGTKAQALDQWARDAGRACVRFDYSGHGESGGNFRDGTIGRWLQESLDVFAAQGHGRQILVGSSMGAWIALLLVRALGTAAVRSRVAGMVLIAPAVDFTEELMWKKMSDDARKALAQAGYWQQPSAYSHEPTVITARLIEEGRQHLLFGGMIETGCPVRILQGAADTDVPSSHAVELVARLAQDDVVLTLIKDGDHRLSRPQDIERLICAIAEI